jgi:hypothetical protein
MIILAALVISWVIWFVLNQASRPPSPDQGLVI